MIKKHYTIPFFIPHEGCPFNCIFCDQKKISGKGSAVSASAIPRTCTEYLKTISKKNTLREVAFFGGSFTAIPVEKQTAYLEAVQPFIKKRLINGIRISTRPDYITQQILDLLKKHHVTCIELGVQSLSDTVLNAAKRGHTASDTKKASRLIIKNGFTLGHQIMVGLPESTLSDEIKTARMSISMKAKEVRIYPVVVIKGTGLAAMWRKKHYTPLTEEEAVMRCARLVDIFRKNDVRVLRCGLHPSPGLITGKDILDGPFHQAFGQKVETYLYGEKLRSFLKGERNPGSIERIVFNSRDAASVIGYKRRNAKDVEAIIKKDTVFVSSDKVSQGNIQIQYSGKKTKLLRGYNS